MPDQSEIHVEVYEGESRKVEANEKIGELKVKRIPKGPPREVMSVRFTFDPNGLLEVDVTVLETGEQFSELFQRGRERLEGRRSSGPGRTSPV